MRRASVIGLVVVAAFASPVRQACGTTCDAPAAPVEALAGTNCHAPATEPAQPQPEHCAHDHSGILLSAGRYLPDTPVAQAQLPSAGAPVAHALRGRDGIIKPDIAASPPPARFLQLRI